MGRTRSVPFDGHAVWVGCDEDVQVPAAAQDAWRSQLANRSQLLTYWAYPQQLTQERVELRAGQRIDYRVYLRGDPYSPDASVRVQPVQGRSSFPQQEVIHEPKQ